jgi:adenine/guanine phosphoribosyltransferase-like PRPP-binding protein
MGSLPEGMSDHMIWDTEPLELLQKLGGYYECPKEESGKRLGPLVGYAGKYKEDGFGENGKTFQYVGDVYANLSIAEQWTEIYHVWADKLKFSLGPLEATVVMGMPMGGIATAFAMIASTHTRFIFAEKQVTALATPLLREQSQLVLGRHELKRGDRVIIAEDVTNNFSTTNEAIQLIQALDAVPVGIASWLNRSGKDIYESAGWALPVLSLINKPFPQYRQDDPEVVADIAAGNVVLKPKFDWPRLEQAMRAARPRRLW